jgi:hypothetical protein
VIGAGGSLSIHLLQVRENAARCVVGGRCNGSPFLVIKAGVNAQPFCHTASKTGESDEPGWRCWVGANHNTHGLMPSFTNPIGDVANSIGIEIRFCALEGFKRREDWIDFPWHGRAGGACAWQGFGILD